MRNLGLSSKEAAVRSGLKARAKSDEVGEMLKSGTLPDFVVVPKPKS